MHQVFQTPYIGTWIAGLVVGIPAGLWDIDTFAELTNIGTLFAFIIVAAGVIVLREEAAGASAILPRAVGAAGADPVDRVLLDSDDGLAAADMDPVLRVAGDRVGGLFCVQPASHWNGISRE